MIVWVVIFVLMGQLLRPIGLIELTELIKLTELNKFIGFAEFRNLKSEIPNQILFFLVFFFVLAVAHVSKGIFADQIHDIRR